MEIRASSQFIRVSPRKVRLVADAVRPLSLPLALAHLRSMDKWASGHLHKTLKSCIANAVNTMKVKEDQLTIKSIMVDEGPSFKRWQPVSRGMAHGYKKRTSHITVVLEAKQTVPLTEQRMNKPTREVKKVEKGARRGPKNKS